MGHEMLSHALHDKPMKAGFKVVIKMGRGQGVKGEAEEREGTSAIKFVHTSTYCSCICSA